MSKRTLLPFFTLFCWLGLLLPEQLLADVEHDSEIPQVVFAAQELNAALKETGQEDLKVTLAVEPDASTGIGSVPTATTASAIGGM